MAVFKHKKLTSSPTHPFYFFFRSLVVVVVIACGAGAASGEKGSSANTPKGNPKVPPSSKKAEIIVPEATGVLRVIGNGAPELRSPSVHVAQQDATRAAEAGVLRDIRRLILSLRLTDTQTLGQKSNRDEALEKRLSDVFSEYETIDRRYYSDGSMDIVAEISLQKVIAALSEKEFASFRKSTNKPPRAEIILDARKVKEYVPTLYAKFLQEDQSLLLGAKPGGVLPSFATSLDAARSLSTQDVVVIRLSENSTFDGALLIPTSNVEQVQKAGLAKIVIVPPKRRK